MSPTVPPISVMTKSTSRRIGHQLDPLLDLVGDVRHDLDGRAEVVAAALAADDGVVDPAGGDVRGAARVRVGEALVVAEVEVGLGAVLGDEHLAVLVRRHRPGIDVDVRVELLQLDVEPARDEQPPDRGCGDSLAERGDDPAGDEDEARLAVCHSRSPSLTGRPTEAARPGSGGAQQLAPRSGGPQQLARVLARGAVLLRRAEHPHELADHPVALELDTVVVAGPPAASLAIVKWRSASAATCGRWVMQRICRPCDERRAGARRPRARCARRCRRRSRRTRAAGCRRRSRCARRSAARASPATARRRRRSRAAAPAGTPALGAIRISIASAPRGPQPSARGAELDLEPGVGHRQLRAAARGRPRRAWAPPCDGRRRGALPGDRARRTTPASRSLGVLERQVGVLELVAARAAALGVGEHVGDPAAVLARQPREHRQPLLDLAPAAPAPPSAAICSSVARATRRRRPRPRSAARRAARQARPAPGRSRPPARARCAARRAARATPVAAVGRDRLGAGGGRALQRLQMPQPVALGRSAPPPRPRVGAAASISSSSNLSRSSSRSRAPASSRSSSARRSSPRDALVSRRASARAAVAWAPPQ